MCRYAFLQGSDEQQRRQSQAPNTAAERSHRTVVVSVLDVLDRGGFDGGLPDPLEPSVTSSESSFERAGLDEIAVFAHDMGDERSMQRAGDGRNGREKRESERDESTPTPDGWASSIKTAARE